MAKRQSQGILKPAQIYGAMAPRPNPRHINSGLSPLKASTAEALLGRPIAAAKKYPRNCLAMDKLSPKFARNLVTATVGPMRVTCHKVMLEPLRKVFREVREYDVNLYNAIGTAGCLCVRQIRGSKFGTASNHSYGVAIDIRINGVLDKFGDDLTQLGLLVLYHFFHRNGFYWGAGFRREDSMHFELADQTLRAIMGDGS